MTDHPIDYWRVVNAILGFIGLVLMLVLSRQWGAHRPEYQLLGIVLGAFVMRDLYGAIEILTSTERVPGGARVWFTTFALSLLNIALVWFTIVKGIRPRTPTPNREKRP